MLKKYKVFLASSGELAQERKEIALMISRQNNKWTEQDIYLELVVWEDLLHSFHGERIQDYFNEEMLQCDIVIALFHRKVGRFTQEEFRLAYKNLKEGKKPNFLFVFFKSGVITIDDAEDSLEDLAKIKKIKEEIKKQEQIYITFTSIEDLTLKLQRQLDQAILLKKAALEQDDEASKEEKAKQDLENYQHHLDQKFKYLDFAGLKAILLKPLALEKVYIKLRAREALPSPREDFKSLEDFQEITAGLKEEKIIRCQAKSFFLLVDQNTGIRFI
jgi:hypothetical protein